MNSQQTHDESNYISKTSCDNCGSSDANAIYDDGHLYCFSCNTYTHPEGSSSESVEATSPRDLGFIEGDYYAIPNRKLTEETCRKWGYVGIIHNADHAQAALYRDPRGKLVAQKIRTKDKNFPIIGDGKGLPLYGSHLWSNGKKLVITEGEIDAMSVSQLQNHKWPVVSLPQGAAGAVRAIKDNWDYVLGFDEIVLMFDQDDPGRSAAEEVSELLPIGRAKIAVLPCKDANECLVQGKGGDVIQAIWQAKEYRPDGIVAATDLRDQVCVEDAASSVVYPYPRLNEIARGIRTGELVTVTAGSGSGKSTFIREIAYSLHQAGERVGMIMLEESNKRTLLGLVGLHMNKNVLVDRSDVTTEEIEETFNSLFNSSTQPLYMYDHFGSNEVELICKRIEFMCKALDVKYVFLDHISILISGLATNDERKLIDMAMTRLRTLVQELDICLFLVSHLRRPEGDRGHEDGSKVRLGQLRGSHAIAQLSDICIGIQVSAEDPDSDQRELKILKNRFTGQVGHAGLLKYSRETGRLLETDYEF